VGLIRTMIIDWLEIVNHKNIKDIKLILLSVTTNTAVVKK
jgi:hypothetical protein